MKNKGMDGRIPATPRRHLKPVHWLASTKSEVRMFPEKAQGIIGYALYVAQLGERHLDAKPLKGFGGAGRECWKLLQMPKAIHSGLSIR